MRLPVTLTLIVVQWCLPLAWNAHTLLEHSHAIDHPTLANALLANSHDAGQHVEGNCAVCQTLQSCRAHGLAPVEVAIAILSPAREQVEDRGKAVPHFISPPADRSSRGPPTVSSIA